MDMVIPEVTLEQFETGYADRHLIHASLDYWAERRPDEAAIVNATRGTALTWSRLRQLSIAYAGELVRMGFRQGDFLATSLPLLDDHIVLEYACFRLGVIHAPLDLRLQAPEVVRCLNSINPRGYVFHAAPLGEAAKQGCDSIEHLLLYPADFAAFRERALAQSAQLPPGPSEHDGAQVIFTTGSTGSSKPALLCHENILVQNIGLAVGFEMTANDRMLINLPPSHVGCVTEQLATTIFGGGVAVILHIFDPQKSLEAIQEHKITTLGQIPALFNMEWRLPEYDKYDLSTLRFAIYGGQAVSREFLEKMSRMAPRIGTGLGLTETAGFCTYTDLEATVDDLVQVIGYDMPLCPLSIREPMQSNGMAGREKAKGEVGEICFAGPQIFLGYLADPENTARTVSRDGICYTGDLGYYDERGLHFSGRSKLVIKPKGFQVFPEDVENHIALKLKGRVGMVACVGVEHAIWSEAIMTFVETTDPRTPVTPTDVLEACQDIAAYSRPAHVVVVEAGKMPLNRVAKTDYMVLKEMAKEEVARLRATGGWDR